MITITVNKAIVYDEVAKTTSYIAAKKVGADGVHDDGAYERVFTTDYDRELIERFWVEACNEATESFSRFAVLVGEQPTSHGVDLSKHYVVDVEPSTMFDEVNMTMPLQTSLLSFFVNAICSKWLAIADKDNAELYGQYAIANMLDVKNKLLMTRRPTRPAPMKGLDESEDVGSEIQKEGEFIIPE